jgi:hypothetical protein
MPAQLAQAAAHVRATVAAIAVARARQVQAAEPAVATTAVQADHLHALAREMRQH